MTTNTLLEETARALVADGKGLLAADETPRTLTKRLEKLSIPSTPESRREYREMLFSSPGISEFISGVILQDETIRQKSGAGQPLLDVLTRQGIIPGIKVDLGVTPFPGSQGEFVTEGLDGLRARLEEYRGMGARFAKWRAVIVIDQGLPTRACVQANAHALARYAAFCQEAEIVPIVEPEVLMEGAHTLERCEEVTDRVLHAVFDQLFEQRVSLEGMLLKPNMAIAGRDCPRQAAVEEVAGATLRALLREVPPAVPGILFLSGGQSTVLATKHLDAINQLEGTKPWKLSFSYGRALQDEAMKAWGGKIENVVSGQRAFRHRAECESAATLGRYRSSMETEGISP
jgi:fructose-bisphosphate aldolase class I